MLKLCCLFVCVGRFIKLNSLQWNLYSPLLKGNKIWSLKNVHLIFVSFTSIQVPCEQRLYFRCVSWRAKSSLCWQPFNFLSCMREIPHAIRSKINRQVCCQMARVSREYKKLWQLWSATQISGRIWMVVDRGYFSHASSHSKNVATARSVLFRGQGHFFYAPKHRFNLHSVDALVLQTWLTTEMIV